jgi:peptidoglycan-associated lipoprotein
MSRIKLFLLVGFAAFLVACGTKVPLTEPARVEDRAPQAVTTPTTNANTNISARDVKAVEVASPVVSSLSNVLYFDFDSYVIKSEAQNLLEAHAKRLAVNRSVKVSLAGHTDDLGGREYNLALGQKRADAVKKALTILGVTDAQMESVSYGKEKPANPGADDAARAQNRRVEVLVR